MLTILSAPIRAIMGFMALIIMMISAIILYLFINNESERNSRIESCQKYLCALLLKCLNVEVQYIGQSHGNAKVYISNHISWLDALLFSPASKLRFIAKSEVKDWPILGLLARLLGTIFIRRENKFQVYRSLPNAQRHIREGNKMMVFPEGTTTQGISTEVFHPMLFEVAVREQCWVQPIAIRYWNHKKQRSQAAPFIDDDGIFMNIIKLLLERKTIAQIHFLPPMNPLEMNRKQMAIHSQHIIQNQLLQPYPVSPSSQNAALPQQVKA